MDDTFTYTQFQISDDAQTVFFGYKLAHNGTTYSFQESLKFPVALQQSNNQLRGLRALHLALGVSYYKIFVSSHIIHPYAMNEAEAAFWNDIWRHGLGEFLYINKLSPEQLATFSTQSGQEFEPESENSLQPISLLGIGGGKDSIVAGELLRQLNIPVEGFVMATGEQRGQAKAVADTMQVACHVIERSLDKQLLEVQEQPGAYKGHIPISLIFGLVGTVLATALKASYVVVANEASASIPRIVSEHGSINHQWSKSFGFEQKLQHYIQEHIANQVTYFSAIRQLTSVGVAKLFANYPQYFEVFTSDNFVFRIDPATRPNARWSLESPKSLSSFMLLAPWLSEADMLRTFGRNFLNEASLESLFKELTGIEGEPPLDCVGTVEELVVSLNLLIQQSKFVDSFLVRVAREAGVITEKDWQAECDILLALQPEQVLPETLVSPIHAALQEKLSV